MLRESPSFSLLENTPHGSSQPTASYPFPFVEAPNSFCPGILSIVLDYTAPLRCLQFRQRTHWSSSTLVGMQNVTRRSGGWIVFSSLVDCSGCAEGLPAGSEIALGMLDLHCDIQRRTSHHRIGISSGMQAAFAYSSGGCQMTLGKSVASNPVSAELASVELW